MTIICPREDFFSYDLLTEHFQTFKDFVIDKGQLVENGTPSDLAADSKSVFRELIYESPNAAGLLQELSVTALK